MGPFLLVAESEGFEPPDRFRSTVFKTAAFDHSANSPKSKCLLSTGCDEPAKGAYYSDLGVRVILNFDRFLLYLAGVTLYPPM